MSSPTLIFREVKQTLVFNTKIGMAGPPGTGVDVLKDELVANDSTWSSQKISSELDHVTVDWSGYYDKSETDALLSDKSNVSHTHAGLYEPANINIQSHLSSTSNPHGVTAQQVGAYTTEQSDILLSGKSDVGHHQDWTTIDNTPSAYPPSSHTHLESEVTGLVTDLANKSNISHTHSLTRTIGATFIDANTLSLPVNDVAVEILTNCSITEVTVLTASSLGSCVFDVWASNFINYPPTVSDSICGASKPTITNGISHQDTVLNGWTTALTAGDIVVFHLESVSGFKTVDITLKLESSL